MSEASNFKKSRRALLLSSFFGGSLLGLRSLATGLPASFLIAPRRALAEQAQPSAESLKPQFLILSTSAAGDPIGNNCPGTYEHPAIVHPTHLEFAATPLTLGAGRSSAAKTWSTLPQSVLDHTCFFHHRSLTNNHADYPKVMRLMGATERGELLPSLFAKRLATRLETVQKEPISLALDGGETLSYEGRVLSALPPLGLKNILSAPSGALASLRQLRDQTLDEMNVVLQADASPAARQFLDRYALSQSQARSISDALLSNLDSIRGNTAKDQAVAAATLVKMRVSPVITCHIPFGSDNHSDADLSAEVDETTSGVATLAMLFDKLAELGVSDSTTVAALNVFGRPLRDKAPAGRDHWQLHNVLYMFGQNVRGGVVGGVRPTDDGRDFQSLPIDSVSGAGNLQGDIKVDESLAAAGKTLGAALGIPASELDIAITQGAIVKSALAAG